MVSNTLRVQELHFRYPDYPGFEAAPLFEGAGMELGEGHIGVLLGVPASGKSTLAGLLARVVPRFTGGELTGSLRLGEADLAGMKPFELVRDAGLVFQSSDDQLLTTRCDLEVAFGLESLGLPRGEMQERVSRALGWMDLEGCRGRDPHSLSGGEKKKLLLACLHAMEPGLWILDETLEEVDAATRRRLLIWLRERGCTVLILTSRWDELHREFADRYFLLGDRRLVTADAPAPPDFLDRVRAAGMTLEPGGAPGDAGARLPARPPAAGTALLRVEGLRYRYAGEGGFDLRVDELAVYPGEVTALVGPNGSGKSTLSRVLCGLLAPEEGRVLVREADAQLQAAAPETLQRFTGYMFQNPDYQIFLPTVREELAYGLLRAGLGREETRRRVESAVEQYLLPPPETPPTLMSYGERKRLQAATYALLERPFLILDEADAGLSYRGFIDLVRRLHAPQRCLMIITHDARLAERLAHRTVHMERGRVTHPAGEAT